MARLPWFRMWSEARNDAKLRRLDDAEFRVWFNLLCYASESDDRGIIPSCNAYLLAVELCNADVTLLKRALHDMAMLHLVTLSWGTDEDDQDVIEIVFGKWNERQYDKPSDQPENVAERVKRYRERKREAASNADVTPRNAIEKRREEEIREERGIADKPPRSVKRAAQIPQPFEITEEMYTWAEQKGISERLVHSESEKFVNYYLGNGRPMKDWCATWENWLLRAIENQAQGRWTGTQMHR